MKNKKITTAKAFATVFEDGRIFNKTHDNEYKHQYNANSYRWSIKPVRILLESDYRKLIKAYNTAKQ
jgi:hypothetical protein